MATKPRTGGLGRGLGALFGEYSIDKLENNSKKPNNTNNDNTNNTNNANHSDSKDNTKGNTKGNTKDDTASSALNDGEVIYVDINDIKPNANQPRKTFNQKKISELAETIVQHGIIQPLVIRKAKSGYELVAGERRWRAAREAGLKNVPCLVRELTDQENMLLAIIENMHREDLNPVEEAEGINQMIKTYGLTQEQVSKSLGKSRPYITNSVRLLSLPKEVIDLLSEGEITAGHARALLAVPGESTQISLAKRIVKEDLSVREIEKIAQGINEPNRNAKPKSRTKSQEILSVEDELKEIFGTKVNIVTNGKRGAVQLEYYSVEELNRLIDLLKTVKQ